VFLIKLASPLVLALTFFVSRAILFSWG